MDYDKISYSIYSESEDGSGAEKTGKIFGKWKLIKFLIFNKFNKSTYSRRKKLHITLEKENFRKW